MKLGQSGQFELPSYSTDHKTEKGHFRVPFQFYSLKFCLNRSAFIVQLSYSAAHGLYFYYLLYRLVINS